jgi:hypothetical protein
VVSQPINHSSKLARHLPAYSSDRPFRFERPVRHN